MPAKPLFMLIACTAFLTGCDSRDAVYERTLSESCSEKCYFWSQTDQDRGAIGKDGMRVYIEPSFGDFDYRFEIVPQPTGCVAIWPEEEFDEKKNYCAYYLVRMHKQVTQSGDKRRIGIFKDFNFILPREDARELFGVADRLSAAWQGGASGYVDGTSVAFELVKNGGVRSMRSASGMDGAKISPAAWIAAEVHRFALAYGPAGQVPRGSDWHSYVNSDGRFPCNNPGLNVPDPDGFGTGDYACARSLPGTSSR